jgi:16S rRNA (uracil1498-N3)-methyltransferase
MSRAATIYRLCIDAPLQTGAVITLDKTQANYMFNVLRLSAGATISVFNGMDGEWQARLEGQAKRTPSLHILTLLREQTQARDLIYYFAPLKSARLDYLMQKGVEMGVSDMVPVITRRVQATRFNAERARANMIEAAEQCEILALPRLLPEIKLEKLLAEWPDDRTLIFCDEAAPLTSPLETLHRVGLRDKLAVLIGPEGGFDPEERRAIMAVPQAVPLSLGPRILRADTAGVVALTLIQAVLGDMK